jgi:3-methyl-2-oxobutanoate hydroxymethyltransferase
MKTITVNTLQDFKKRGEKVAALTSYDASFARVLDQAGVDVQLVGDSLGMVIQGNDTTVAVRMDDMIYHSRLVSGACQRSIVITDLSFMSYATPEQALHNAARLVSEGGANMVKLEGGGWVVDTVALLDTRGIPVCAHLGLLPQSINKLGGYRVQGRDSADALRMKQDALALQEAGACVLVLESVPRALARDITASLAIPTIGIGAGGDCDGQVLVLHDVLGLSAHSPRFTKNFLTGSEDIQAAVARYVNDVKAGTFPGPEHGFD